VWGWECDQNTWVVYFDHTWSRVSYHLLTNFFTCLGFLELFCRKAWIWVRFWRMQEREKVWLLHTHLKWWIPWHIKGPSLMSLAFSNKWNLKGKKIGNNKREPFKCTCNNKCNKYNKWTTNSTTSRNPTKRGKKGKEAISFRGLLWKWGKKKKVRRGWRKKAPSATSKATSLHQNPKVQRRTWP